jgi:hypothetical protein
MAVESRLATAISPVSIMNYGNSSESTPEVMVPLALRQDHLGRLFLAAIETTSLRDVDVEISYVPILMPPDSARNYPARSRNVRKDRRMEVSPQLDYDRFTKGDLAERWNVVIDGFATARDMFKRAGLTAENLKDFDDTVALLRGQVPDMETLMAGRSPEVRARILPSMMKESELIAKTRGTSGQPPGDADR